MSREIFDLPPYSEIWSTKPEFTLTTFEKSEWKCYLFGTRDGSGIVWQPNKGGEPNWFWRKMQFLILGNRWVKG
jgi:hypothetical protein